MEMDFYQAIAIITLFNFKLSGGIDHSLSGVVINGVDWSRDAQAAELPILMDYLDRHYTPQCLRVIISHGLSVYMNSSATTINTHVWDSLHSQAVGINYAKFPKANTNIRFVPTAMNQIEKTMDYINKNMKTMNSKSCVTYMLLQPPDSRLLFLLTQRATKKSITRHFLIYSQNITSAENFLLDKRLEKEENVAALVQEESQNKSYWRVLIRQLLHPSGSPQVLTVNKWSRDTGLTSTENIFPEQMANFYGKKLIGSVLSFIPYSDFQRFEGSLVVKLKPCVNRYILDILAQQLNFTYEMRMPADGKWGNRDESGHFVGIVGDVEFERANFAFDLSVTRERAQNVEFTEYYSFQALTFLTAKSRPDPLWRKLITPFRGTVWVCVLVSVGGGALLYHVIYHAQATLTSSRLLSSHAFMDILASFLSQSLHSYLSLQAGKVFLGFWFLYSFLVTSYYSTSLTSTLAVPFAPSTIDTLEQLQQSGLYCGMKAAKGAAYALFATSSDPVYQHVFKQLRFGSTSDIMKKVAEGQYSFIAFSSLLQLLAAIHNNNPKRKTDIHMARETFFPSGNGCAVPQGAPYLRTFNAVMQRCLKAGLITKWIDDTIPNYLKKPEEEDSEDEEEEDGAVKSTTNEVVLNLNHLQGPFFILFLGSAGGALVLLLETFTFRYF